MDIYSEYVRTPTYTCNPAAGGSGQTKIYPGDDCLVHTTSVPGLALLDNVRGVVLLLCRWQTEGTVKTSVGNRPHPGDAGTRNGAEKMVPKERAFRLFFQPLVRIRNHRNHGIITDTRVTAVTAFATVAGTNELLLSLSPASLVRSTRMCHGICVHVRVPP